MELIGSGYARVTRVPAAVRKRLYIEESDYIQTRKYSNQKTHVLHDVPFCCSSLPCDSVFPLWFLMILSYYMQNDNTVFPMFRQVCTVLYGHVWHPVAAGWIGSAAMCADPVCICMESVQSVCSSL